MVRPPTLIVPTLAQALIVPAVGSTLALTSSGTPSTAPLKLRLKPGWKVTALGPAPMVPPAGAITRLASSTVSAFPNLRIGVVLSGAPIWKAKIGPVSDRLTAIERAGVGPTIGDPLDPLQPFWLV